MKFGRAKTGTHAITVQRGKFGAATGILSDTLAEVGINDNFMKELAETLGRRWAVEGGAWSVGRWNVQVGA